MTKLAQGLLDLHSRRGAVDVAVLARFAEAASSSDELCTRIAQANTAAEAFAQAAADGVALGNEVARAAQETARQVVAGTAIAIEVVLFGRDGERVGRAPFPPAHDRPLNLRR
jgi:cobalt-precorrin-5B (C1)-methyltransferase